MAYDEMLAERIRSKLKRKRGLTEAKIFGGVGFLINGNMACGVIKLDMIVRLDPADFEASLKQRHVRVFDMSGRPMKGWIYVAPEGLKKDDALQGWIDQAVKFARSLPSK
jgi:hypothetical protein